jgi:hypothetical protein
MGYASAVLSQNWIQAITHASVRIVQESIRMHSIYVAPYARMAVPVMPKADASTVRKKLYRTIQDA